jgi:glycogen(starch) synthase
MRLTYWCEYFWPSIGGVEILAGRFLAAMQKRGYQTMVVTSHHRAETPAHEEHEGIPVFRFPFWSVLASGNATEVLETTQAVNAAIGRFQPDVMHVNASVPTLFFSLRTVAKRPTPMLLALRGALDGYSGATDTLFPTAARSAAWVSAVSTAILGDARRLVPDITERSSVIYNGLAPPAIAPAPLSFEPTRLLCIGRLVPLKGFEIAVEALAVLARRYPRVEMIVAGEGRARPGMERAVHAAGLSEKVRFVGWVRPEEVPELINSATIVVMPSRTEGLPQVAIQAAQMGRPVVGSRIAGLAEVVVDGETGVLVVDPTGSSLADAIGFLIEHQDEARRLGAAAQRRARSLFDWEPYLDAHDSLYRILAKEVSR